ncbi:hypothetical protein FRC08_017414, partial [Ceratobasidium sp. 394]
ELLERLVLLWKHDLLPWRFYGSHTQHEEVYLFHALETGYPKTDDWDLLEVLSQEWIEQLEQEQKKL